MNVTPNQLHDRGADRGAGRKPSRAAEYVAILYVALVLLTPWLLRDASLLAPPSRGVEIQVVDRATAMATPELKATQKVSAPAMPVRAN